jgi:hypothetical protein
MLRFFISPTMPSTYYGQILTAICMRGVAPFRIAKRHIDLNPDALNDYFASRAEKATLHKMNCRLTK